MYPKTALKLLGIMIVCLALFFAFIVTKQKLDLKRIENLESLEVNNQENLIDDIVERKNKGEEIGEEEQKQLNEILQQTIEEEHQKLNKKDENREEYTQEELGFIFNPQETAEKELGIEQEEEKPGERFTQEELDNIFNQ